MAASCSTDVLLRRRHLDRIHHGTTGLLLQILRAPVPELRPIEDRIQDGRSVAAAALPAMPDRRLRASTPPSPTLWQELQLIAWLAESLGSKYSMFPSSTFAGVAGLPGSAGGMVGIGLNCACAAVIRLSCSGDTRRESQRGEQRETTKRSHGPLLLPSCDA